MSSEKTQTFSRSLLLLKPYFPFLLIAGACMVIYGASDGAIPILVKIALGGQFTSRIGLEILVAILLAFGATRAITRYVQQYLMASVGHRVVTNLRNTLHQKLLSLPPSFFVDHSAAALLSRLNSDTLLLRGILTDGFTGLLRDLVRLTAVAVSVFYLDPYLATVACIALPLGAIPIHFIGRAARKASRRAQATLGELSAHAQESILGHRVIQSFHQEQYQQSSFQSHSEKTLFHLLRSESLRAISGPVGELLAIGAVCGVILYGGEAVVSGERSQGDFIAFVFAVILLYQPFKSLSSLVTQLQIGLAGADRVFELLDVPSQIQNPPKPASFPRSHEIHFKNVSYGYAGRQPVLRNIRITISEGERVAIVGLSGAGKTTLIDLVPRFIDPSAGKVLFGGIDVRTVTLEELRSRIAYVDQHTFLFHTSLIENIRFGRPNASEKQILDALEAAQLSDLLSRLPQGLHTIVGEAGLKLSAGERQRVAVARAMIKDAPVVLLDEATSSLDGEADSKLQTAIDLLATNRTCISVAHRGSTIQRSPRIILIEQGTILSEGSHADLMRVSSHYASLIEPQRIVANS